MDRPASWVALIVAIAMGLHLPERLGLSPDLTLEIVEWLVAGGAMAFAVLARWRARRDEKKAGHAIALVVLGLMVGCATIPLHTDADPALVDTAADRLGFEPEYLSAPDGAIDVEIVPKRHYHHGEATQTRGCQRKVVSTADSAVLAHELGHALGLGHVDAPDNLMTPHAGDDAGRLTAAQRRTMAGHLALLRACREGAR